MCRKHLKWLHNCYNDKNNRNNNKKKCTQNKKVAKVLTKSLANKSSLKSFRKLYQICLGYKIPCNSNDEILRHTYIRKGIFSAQPNIYDEDNHFFRFHQITILAKTFHLSMPLTILGLLCTPHSCQKKLKIKRTNSKLLSAVT